MKPNTRISKTRTRSAVSRGLTQSIPSLWRTVTPAILCVSLIIAHSQASPIIYTFAGIGGGSVNGARFGNLPFTVKVYSDTTNVAVVGFTGGRNIYSADASLATFTIAGFGSGQFTEATRVFDSQGLSGLGFSISYALGGYDIWDFGCDAAGNYDLASPLAPVSIVHSPWGADLIDQPTTRGPLSFTSIRNMTFSATVLPGIGCPNDSVVECGEIATVLTLVSDPDGDPLTVVWTLNNTTVQTNLLPGTTSPTGVNVSFSAVLPLGTNLLSVTVSDTESNTASCSTSITVVDTTPPTIDSAHANPALLWPPNHKLVPVNVDASVTHECSPSSWKVIKVSSSEAPVPRAGGHPSPDWRITGDHTVLLRAERTGNGVGRIYTISIEATDQYGNTSQKNVTVTVPHDLGKQTTPSPSSAKGTIRPAAGVGGWQRDSVVQ